MEESKSKSLNFLEEIVQADLAAGKYPQGIFTRFPPEPNGYLHIGHAKSICLNFGLAQKFGGKTNLRFDDTNPMTEETEYVDSIKSDVAWLGFEWENELYASNYFEQIYQFAVSLIKKGLAYVDDSSAEDIAALKGTPTTPGTNSPYRDRSVDENLALFAAMRNGEFPDGAKVLRAKIDMAHPNMHMRDPLMYRIRHVPHHRTGNQWCIYPMYDFAHGQSDSMEGITHSICTLEFDVHRPLYDWFINKLEIFTSHQYEFARLNLSHTVMSKRKLLQMVNEKVVSGWDDPRMPTISALRRRGYTAASIRNFCERIGVAKRDNLIDISLLEFCIREDLNKIADRVMAVMDPVKLIISNYPEGQTEDLLVENNPEDLVTGKRIVPFSRELYIEREDFMVEPPKKFFRLGPGLQVRLKGAYIITCDHFELNSDGSVKEIHASYIPESKSGQDTSGIHVKGTIHWVSIPHAVQAEVRLFDRLLIVEDASELGDDFVKFVNPESLQIIENAFVEPSLAEAKIGEAVQFIRKGYYCLDRDSKPGHLVFNRTVTLKDTWAKEQKK
ncbi:glutamine--tRNA ligase/YqeY domain fusion protein [Aquirufa regiilacus]|uniref:Glutamine--tRNA ligase n=1 Tax=Aquirufa regiilacus TaxID=3024868 RepID=A0ABU3TSN0_9BACT|nr:MULTISPECIES: glutamine--tRNA ligase/YqeY domain fusion protein [unclassified Aquirufa]MDT8886544.1 glutamine--tRNA ligase/YqeY domain fusion protein [Aquirufa sp. LEPPI-3A]MDU0808874.1 glutamine--tRNA ligase/YqeY domain fusion protein [Aquirufa sp. LEOWEIH-7C]